MAMTTQNGIPGNSGTQNRTRGKRAEGLPSNNIPEISDTLSPAPGTDGKRDHVADVSDEDSPLYNPADPDFDPNWDDEDRAKHDNVNPTTDAASKKRNDSTGTGGISGIPMTGNASISSARGVVDSILAGKK